MRVVVVKAVGESAKAVETCAVEKAVEKMVECAVGVTDIALQSLCWVVLGAHVVYQGGMVRVRVGVETVLLGVAMGVAGVVGTM